MTVDHEKKSDGVRVHHEKKVMGSEFTIRESDGVRVYQEKKSDGVRGDHE